MEKIALEKIDLRLSKAVLFKDAFTQETVVNAVRIKTFYGGRAILKQDGYCLFLNVGQEEFEVEVESPIYQSRHLWLKADRGEEVEEVFLYPKVSYPVKTGVTIVQGTAVPGAVIKFHLEDGDWEGKLLRDYQKGEEEIEIFLKGKIKIGNRMWYVRDREKKIGEYCNARVTDAGSEKFGLTCPLKADYRKKDTDICQAYECTADEKGEFYLLIDRLDDRDFRLAYLYSDDGKEVVKEAGIQGTKWNVINEN